MLVRLSSWESSTCGLPGKPHEVGSAYECFSDFLYRSDCIALQSRSLEWSSHSLPYLNVRADISLYLFLFVRRFSRLRLFCRPRMSCLYLLLRKSLICAFATFVKYPCKHGYFPHCSRMIFDLFLFQYSIFKVQTPVPFSLPRWLFYQSLSYSVAWIP